MDHNHDGIAGWELPDSGRLPAGELVFMQTFRGRFGNPLECLVFLGETSEGEANQKIT